MKIRPPEEQERDIPRALDSTHSTDRPQSRGRSIAEWTTLTISIAIVAGVVGLVTLLSFKGGELPPIIKVEPKLDELRRDEGGYYLPVIVRNEGDATAEEVHVEAKLDTGTGEPETAEFTIDFLAGGEQVEGTFVFEGDPSKGELTTRAISFRIP